jgi:hypothetical protein
MEVYAIKVCADESIRKRYSKRNIYVLSNSQAVIKSLDNCRICSRLVWDCHQSLMTLDECNRINLLWMPRHLGIEGTLRVHPISNLNYRKK